MSGVLIVYGASDDLIETEGFISDEFGAPYNKPALFKVEVDGKPFVDLRIEYDDEGEWRIQPMTLGELVKIVRAPGENDDGPIERDEHGCPAYSDKAEIDMLGIDASRVKIKVGVAA